MEKPRFRKHPRQHADASGVGGTFEDRPARIGDGQEGEKPAERGLPARQFRGRELGEVERPQDTAGS